MKRQYWKQTKQILITGITVTAILFSNSNIVMASDETDPNCITPEENQYLELRAVEVKEVAGQNKQVMMELWGNNLDFKRI
ncbi:MAG: hypothetical protein J6A04_07820 [Clostridia bacterium]|nr:hypothetical protein [Clostridia bacterium]